MNNITGIIKNCKDINDTLDRLKPGYIVYIFNRKGGHFVSRLYPIKEINYIFNQVIMDTQIQNLINSIQSGLYNVLIEIDEKDSIPNTHFHVASIEI